jgi:hypothetical protein
LGFDLRLRHFAEPKGRRQEVVDHPLVFYPARVIVRCTTRELGMHIRPRRSVLYMPGANERALEKAKTLPADSLILDLEDSVAPEAKLTARASVCAAVKEAATAGASSSSAPTPSRRLHGRPARGGGRSPDAILVPKVPQPGDVVTVAKVLGHRGVAEDAPLGHDGDAELGLERARDRRARRRPGESARLPRHGHQRPP